MNENKTSASTVKKKAKRGKFNLMDFLIIIVLLAVIALIVNSFFSTSFLKKITSDKTVEIQYAIEVQGVDEAYLRNISENDVVLDSVSKSDIGTVTAVDYSTQYTELVCNEEENVGVLSPVAGKYNVIITVSATAQYKSGEGYTVNGTRIAVGEKINARFPNYVCEGYCISIPLD